MLAYYNTITEKKSNARIERSEKENTVMLVLKSGLVSPITAMIAYEEGELDDDDTITMFQHLIDTGMAWQLQGSYGRTAIALVKEGLCKLPNEPTYDYYGNRIPTQKELDEGKVRFRYEKHNVTMRELQDALQLGRAHVSNTNN